MSAYTRAGKIFLHTRAMPGAPHAGRLWALYRDEHMLSWSWMRFSFEFRLFYRSTTNGKPIRLLADTDDALLLSPSHIILDALRRPFTAECQVTVQRFNVNTSTIQYAGLNISCTVHGLCISIARNVSQLLREHGADSACPRVTPWPQHTDLTALRQG